jgi:hypothetical protein
VWDSYVLIGLGRPKPGEVGDVGAWSGMEMILQGSCGVQSGGDELALSISEGSRKGRISLHAHRRDSFGRDMARWSGRW